MLCVRATCKDFVPGLAAKAVRLNRPRRKSKWEEEMCGKNIFRTRHAAGALWAEANA